MQKIDKEKSCVLMLSLLIALFVYQYVARSVFPSVLANEYMKFFNLNAKSVSTLISCYYFLYVFLQIPAGLIVDRFSIRLVSTLSALLCATGILLFVSTSNYYIACLGQMLAGFGASSAFISTIKAVIEWFPENKHSILISISASIGGIGPVIFGPLVTLAVKGIHWRIVILMYSLLGFLLALSIWFLVKNKPNEEIRASKSTHKSSITLVDSLKMILFSPQAWVLFLFSMAQHAPITAIADSWGTSFIKRLYNADPIISSMMNNMLYIGLVIGGPIFSYFSSKIKSYKIPLCISSFFAMIIFIIIMHFEVSITFMPILLLLLGFFSGAPLAFPLSTSKFPSHISATVSGFINTGCMMGGVILLPIVGHLIDKSWNGAIENGIKIYSTDDFYCGFTSVIAFLLFAFILATLIKDKKPRQP